MNKVGLGDQTGRRQDDGPVWPLPPARRLPTGVLCCHELRPGFSKARNLQPTEDDSGRFPHTRLSTVGFDIGHFL